MTAGARTPAADYVPGHGDASFSVTHYDLSMDYRVEGNRLTGRATLTCRADADLEEVALDLFGLEVSKVSVDGRAPARYTHRDSRLRVRFARTVPEDSAFTVVIGYHGRPGPMPGPDGEAGWEELADGVIVAGQPHGAPSWFPCNDRPSDKASYRVTVSVPSDYHVVGNGSLELTRRQASTTTWVYHQPEPMAPYLATLQIGRYTVCPLKASVPMEVVLPPARVGDVDTAFGRQPEMLDLFVELFGDYPYAGYRVVVTEDELEIPLEAQGLSVFGSNYLIGDWKTERLVAHELSHQWFGNSLTVSSWADIWLHEGFACYAEWLWSERSGRESADEQARTHWERLSDEPQDLLLGDPGPEDMFDDRVYKRGALLLHALRLAVGDEQFFGLLRDWVSRHAHGNVATVDFTTLAVERTGQPVEPLFDRWLYDVDLPELPAPRG